MYVCMCVCITTAQNLRPSPAWFWWHSRPLLSKLVTRAGRGEKALPFFADARIYLDFQLLGFVQESNGR